MNRQQLKKLPLYIDIIDILMSDVGYKWKFISDSGAMGYTSCCDKEMLLDTRLLTRSEDEFWSTVLHELQHAICQRTGLYPELHRQSPLILGEIDLVYFESKIDEMAEAAMAIYFPELKYIGNYKIVLEKMLKSVEDFHNTNQEGEE